MDKNKNSERDSVFQIALVTVQNRLLKGINLVFRMTEVSACTALCTGTISSRQSAVILAGLIEGKKIVKQKW